MLSIRLKPALERRLSRLARQTGRTKASMHQAHRGKTSKTLRTATSPKPVSRIAASATPQPRSGGSLLRRLSTTRAPSRTSRNSIARYSAKSSTSWKSASARRRTRAPLQAASPQQVRSVALSPARLLHHRQLSGPSSPPRLAIGHRSIIYDANQGPSAATDLCCLLRPRQGALCLFPFRTRGTHGSFPFPKTSNHYEPKQSC